MSAVKSIYKVLRSVILIVISVAVGILLASYLIISIPSVQESIKKKAESYITDYLKGKVTVSELQIFPFNEVRLYGVNFFTPKGERCISVGRIGAGIDLWKLLSSGEITITYAEIISMNARLEQSAPDATLNIQYIIDAIKPKEKKQKKHFNLVIHNVVIRKSKVAFRRSFIPVSTERNKLDFNNLEFFNVNADVSIPKIANDNFSVDLRRLTLVERSGFDLKTLSLKTDISPKEISVRDLVLKIGSSRLLVSDQTLHINGFNSIINELKKAYLSVVLSGSPVYPADFAAFYPPLNSLDNPFDIHLAVSGNADRFEIEDFKVSGCANTFDLEMEASANGFSVPRESQITLENLSLHFNPEGSSKILSAFNAVPFKVVEIIRGLGNTKLEITGMADLSASASKLTVDLSSDAGFLTTSGNLTWTDGNFSGDDLIVITDEFNIGSLLNIKKLGAMAIDASGDLKVKGKDISGSIIAEIPFMEYQGNRFTDLQVEAEKNGSAISGHIEVDDESAKLYADISCMLAGAESEYYLKSNIETFVPTPFGIAALRNVKSISGEIEADVTGNSPDTFIGVISLSNFDFKSASELHVDRIDMTAANVDGKRKYSLESDFFTLDINGEFTPSAIVPTVKNLVAEALPTIVTPVKAVDTNGQSLELELTLNPSDRLYSLLKTPVSPGVPVSIKGGFEGSAKSVSLDIDAPYIIQGKNKLIKDTKISVKGAVGSPLLLDVKTSYPLKNDRAGFNAVFSAAASHVNADLNWKMDGNPDNEGKIGIGMDITRKPLTKSVTLNAVLQKSSFKINDAVWNISPALIYFSDKVLTVSSIRVMHDMQYVTISGRASDNPIDAMNVELAGIDLQYLFDILNINHVDFGGVATGTAHVSNLFSGVPVAQTDGLFVKNLAYHGSVIGDAQLESHWEHDSGLVAINADIQGPGDESAKVRGGVYVTRDSLSFDFLTHKINIECLKPYVSGFTSSLTGHATGNVKLFGTFSDIDLVGKVFADTVTMKVDYTNVSYSASDSIFFLPGKINIPQLRLYDKYGNSGLFSGEVRHHYLKDAEFDFELGDARHLLGLDVVPSEDSQWSGHIFVNGNGKLNGVPGAVVVDINASTAPGSEFTFVLEETQTAEEYSFLTFSDRRKDEVIHESTEVNFEDRFLRKSQNENDEEPSVFVLNLVVNATPDINVILVMDPAAGDKIKATGSGDLQMHYDTSSDEITLYGKYIINKGSYNFSLQDLILKNFKIESGSSITFNGDPVDGILDITASYRVNTNLTDLDPSFKDDGDLNRTSVPVDALLKIAGDVHSPDIKFDLRLPTMNPEAERKMRSIVSTEDMLNRQVIYLLALNRFYTPEYAGGSQGGEFASVASSTISSQIQNMISSITDKFSVSPTFRSEKSDLSDMEFDVALSSSLFNNRLLLNGNLGYRDKSTSNTTFIGDFDLEYLLTRDGKLRLKAYNHFNDASYYLKSSLTTQGIGIIYRKDFDDPFTFLKRHRRKKDDAKKE